MFTYQQIDEEAYFKCVVLKVFIHLPFLDIRDTVNYKEVMKQYPFLSKYRTVKSQMWWEQTVGSAGHVKAAAGADIAGMQNAA